jgi:hypothetical protein
LDKCLSRTTGVGRMELGSGMSVPTPATGWYTFELKSGAPGMWWHPRVASFFLGRLQVQCHFFCWGVFSRQTILLVGCSKLTITSRGHPRFELRSTEIHSLFDQQAFFICSLTIKASWHSQLVWNGAISCDADSIKDTTDLWNFRQTNLETVFILDMM